ncbi:MAG: sulfide/dihydroorotate dehydrogenase-like FAD/NAD-binding protein [Elusimicrobiota bacterium]
MNEIKKAQWIGQDIRDIWIENGTVARNFAPGQFLIILLDEESERVPMSIIEKNGNEVRVVIKKAGYTTSRICRLEPGDRIKDIAGPLGKKSEIKKYGSTVCIGGGIGIASVKPVALALKDAGNKINIIEGVKSREFSIMEEELEQAADNFTVVSEDGSAGKKGLPTDILENIVSQGIHIDLVYAVGPVEMMKKISEITIQHSIPLKVSLNPIMVDGTGMCGSCRVEVDNEIKFACVDGPEFDGNKVNYDLLIKRLKMYSSQEKRCLISK